MFGENLEMLINNYKARKYERKIQKVHQEPFV